jgi:DNA-binding MltR family transcriptional regulator
MGYGPLSSFRAKIDIAYALGAISQKTRTELSHIKGVRNKFAHSYRPINFESGSIVKKCQPLSTMTLHPGDCKKAYMAAITQLIETLKAEVDKAPWSQGGLSAAAWAKERE